MKAIIGEKLGMTRFFTDEGVQLPCTIIKAGPCLVSQVKTNEKDGYSALQLAYKDKKKKLVNKSVKKHFAKVNAMAKQVIREFRDCSLDKKAGEYVHCTIFQTGDIVEIVGISKGKGFQGVVKRHGFSGVGEASHGQHDRDRAPGSIGASSFPSRVFKGKRMAGQHGGASVKVRGLEVVKVLSDQNFILVKGSIPGCNNSIVYIQSSRYTFR